EPAASLGEVAVYLPEASQRRREPERLLRLACFERECEGAADVPELDLEALEPLALLPRLELRLRFLGERDQVREVAATQHVLLGALGEPLERVFPHRLEH